MPTVILLDVSLSMCRLSSRQPSHGHLKADSGHTTANGDAVELRQLANVGIMTLLDYLAQNAQLEHTALVIFSSLWEIRSQFTRNHETIKNGIYDLELYDKSNIVNALRGVSTMKLDEWSQNGVINIILITDGHYITRRSTLTQKDDFGDISLDELEGSFDFPCKIQVVCLCSARDPAMMYNLGFFKKLVATIDSASEDCPVMVGTNIKYSKSSTIWFPESSTSDISVQSVENLFNKIAESHYKPYHSLLSFGRLSSMVLLSPKPSDCYVEPTNNNLRSLSHEQSQKDPSTIDASSEKIHLFTLNEEIAICGFMSSNEVASPAVTSRHLIVPISHSKFDETSKAQQILSQDPNAYSKTAVGSQACINTPSKSNIDTSKAANKASSTDNSPEQDLTKQPSFCVLLHNCLKQENTVAVCIVGRNAESNEDWFGILYPHVDARKRSNLMLSLLQPGSRPILWLPDFRSLGSSSLNCDSEPALIDKNARAPLKSYSSNNVIWLDPESVQADVQKIVRHVKRGLDKAPHFYKELNRIRRAAISYGFYDVLAGLATILEREKRAIQADQTKPGNTEIIAHVDNVIRCLQTDLNDESYDTRLMPPI